MSEILSDLQHALRALARRPGFALVAVLTLALGIGACTAMSAVVYRLLVAPLPFEDGDRLGYPWLRQGQSGMMVTPRAAVAQAWQEGARTLERVEVYGGAEFTVSGDGVPEVVAGARISPTLAATLGVRPVLGRPFVEGDASANAVRVALLDEGYWRSRYGGDPEALGRSIVLDGEPHTIVGVMPTRLGSFDELGRERGVWVPFVADPDARGVNVLVKVRRDVTFEAAAEELNAIAAAVPDARPLPGEWQTSIVGPADFLGDRMRRSLVVLLAAVGVVLLIACANVAGLLLARGETRRREIAIRVALGASRGRVLRFLGAESVLLALAGGALGLLIATWSLDLVRGVRPRQLEELDAVALDTSVVVLAAMLSLLTALIFGVVPALAGSRSQLTEAMKGTSAGSTAANSSTRLRGLMVSAQIALCLVLLVGAGLLMQTVAQLQRRDIGFDAAGLLTLTLNLPSVRYPSGESRQAFFRRVLEEVRALPGVADAAQTTGAPPDFGVVFGELSIEDGEVEGPASRAFAGVLVEHTFFRTLRVPVLEGRTFGEHETDEVVVINRAMARKYWVGESALGKRFRLSETAAWQTVIGVVGDVAASGLASREDREQIYYPATFDFPDQRLVVRAASGDPRALLPALRAIIERIDPELPLRDAATVQTMMERSIARERFNTGLLSVFAFAALLLACIGLYGLISFSVAQRTREIGVRMALGAAPASVRRMVLRQGATLVLTGLVVGGLAALAAVRLLGSLLHGVRPYDPASFTGAALVIAAAAILASYLPASRASTVDPLVALRSE